MVSCLESTAINSGTFLDGELLRFGVTKVKLFNRKFNSGENQIR